MTTQTGAESRHVGAGSVSGLLFETPPGNCSDAVWCVLLLNYSSVAWRMVQTSQVVRQELELDGGLP